MAIRRFHVVVEWEPDSEAWVTVVPALNYLSTYGDSRTEALEQTREAILGYLEAATELQLAIPDDSAADIVEIEVAAS